MTSQRKKIVMALATGGIIFLWFNWLIMPNVGFVRFGPKMPNRVVKSLDIGWRGIGAAWPYTLPGICLGACLTAVGLRYVEAERRRKETIERNKLYEWARETEDNRAWTIRAKDELAFKYDRFYKSEERHKKECIELKKKQEYLQNEEKKHKQIRDENDRLEKDLKTKDKLLVQHEQRIVFLERQLCTMQRSVCEEKLDYVAKQ